MIFSISHARLVIYIDLLAKVYYLDLIDANPFSIAIFSIYNSVIISLEGFDAFLNALRINFACCSP